MSRPAVLYYSLPGNKKANKTRSLLLRLGVRLISVAPEDTQKTIGELIGRQEIKEADLGAPLEESVHEKSGASFPEELPSLIEDEVMVFFNFSEGAFDRVLRELKKSHVPDPLKAVVTGTNVSWPFIRLYAELRREREYIRKNK